MHGRRYSSKGSARVRQCTVLYRNRHLQTRKPTRVRKRSYGEALECNTATRTEGKKAYDCCEKQPSRFCSPTADATYKTE